MPIPKKSKGIQNQKEMRPDRPIALHIKHYIFGYGSLMNASSRLTTLPLETHAFPVIVKGLERTWSYKCNESKYTAVAVKASASICNGVLLELSDPIKFLSLLDKREKEYERAIIDHSQIIPWKANASFGKDENSIVWVYKLPNSKRSNHIPSSDYPIPQSYIDTILEGCLNYGYDFVKAFLTLTRGWTRDYVLNDRKKPLKKFTLNSSLIDPRVLDDLIQENVIFE